MKRRYLFLVVGLFTFLIGVTVAALWSGQRPVQQFQPDSLVSRSRAEDEVAEALFRYQLLEHQGLHVYFLSRDGADPTDDFMTRFQGEIPLKKKRSLSMRGKYRRILDKETGAVGGITNVGSLKWISDSEVEIAGSLSDGEVVGYVYRLMRENGGWIVKSSEFVMES